MKHIFSLLLCLLPCFSFAQSAPEIEGNLIRSEVLVFQDKVAGYYRLTDNRQPDDEKYVYTITLLGNDLQPLGNKVYESEDALTFGSIAYNGTYLGIVHEKTEYASKPKCFIDFLDGSGAKIDQKVYSSYLGSSFLLPTKEGFVSCFRKRIKGLVVFDVNLIAFGEDSLGWTKTFSSEKEEFTAQIVDYNSERMTLSVDRSRKGCNKDVYCLDLKTGAMVFKYMDEDEPSTLACYKELLTGALVDGGAVLVYDSPKSTKLKPRKNFELHRFDERGELMMRKIFSDEDFFNQALAENKLPALEEDFSVKRLGIQTSGEGFITVVYEVASEQDKAGERIKGKGLEYRDAYVITITPDLKIGPLIKLEKNHFSLAGKDVDYVTTEERLRLIHRIRNGQFNKVSLSDWVEFHGGPYGFALSVGGTDYISNFFLDRDFSKEEGVTYLGIKVATYIDGEFELDYIPFKNKPDFITLGRARDGYLKVTEYKYGEGIVDVRLERLNY